VRHFYFDYNATAPLAPEVLEDLTRTLGEVAGNASSIHHYGQVAKQRLEQARREVAALLGCDPKEIVFTSGGTESDNLAVFGSIPGAPAGKHVITSAIEHPAVLNSCARLEKAGAEVSYIAPDAAGLVRPEAIAAAIRRETVLITIMHANNETGVIQPIREIAGITHEAGAVFHSDGVQMAGRMPVRVRDLGVDLYSVSGHKFGAPKGIGALYVRKGVVIDPILYGGHHERDRRAGTENVPGAAALGKAASLAGLGFNSAPSEIGALRDRLERRVLETIPAARINGFGSPRIPNTSSIRFDGIEGEAIVIAMDLAGYAISSGSACSSGAVEPSHVLLAMGLTPEEARSSVRISLGPGNTVEQVDGLADALERSVAHLRRVSPAVVAHA
jgi:cysteine desulfurase